MQEDTGDMEVTTWTCHHRIPEGYSACSQCLAAQALLMVLDVAYQAVAGVVALVNCLCRWQGSSAGPLYPLGLLFRGAFAQFSNAKHLVVSAGTG